MRYQEKNILITGASSGIGRAVAVALSHHRTNLVVTARRAELLESLAREIESNGSRCFAFPGDATDRAHAENVVAGMFKGFGSIDIAILNVGAGPASNTLTGSVDSILHAMRTNYDSLVNFYVPIMRQMKSQSSECMIS